MLIVHLSFFLPFLLPLIHSFLLLFYVRVLKQNIVHTIDERAEKLMGKGGRAGNSEISKNRKQQTLGLKQKGYSVPESCLIFVTPWIVAHQASLSITNSQGLLKLMSIELVMPSNHLILCHPLLLPASIFPSIRVFPMSQLFPSGGQNMGVSASVSVLPVNIQD